MMADVSAVRPFICVWLATIGTYGITVPSFTFKKLDALFFRLEIVGKGNKGIEF